MTTEMSSSSRLVRYLIFENKNSAFGLVTVLSFILTFGVILPSICHTWAYSSYFVADATVEQTVRRALELNDKRLDEARTYLDQLSTVPSPKERMRAQMEEIAHAQSDKVTTYGVDLAVGIVTVKRENSEIWSLGYLTQVTAQLRRFAALDAKFERKALFICNVDYVPYEHTEALRMSDYIAMVTRFNKSHVEQENEDLFEKEKDDYIYCLKSATLFKPEYIVLLQDDAVPTDTFFDTIHYLLFSRVLGNEVGRETSGKDNGEWLYLKLYHPEKWRGYSSNFPNIVELFGFGCIGWAISALLAEFLLKDRNAALLRLVSRVTGVVYVLGVVYTIGRPYIIQLWSFSAYTHRAVAAPGCCIPAVLFPAVVADVITDYLSSIKCHIDFSVDLALDWLADLYHYQTFLVEPNIVQHIGLWSSLRTWAKSAAEFA